jgi:hypothetical protein
MPYRGGHIITVSPTRTLRFDMIVCRFGHVLYLQGFVVVTPPADTLIRTTSTMVLRAQLGLGEDSESSDGEDLGL